VGEYVLNTQARHDLFDAGMARKMWREHKSGLRDRTTELWVILMFNMWYERFVQRGVGE